MKKLTIGRLSKIVGMPTKTIRFYEEEGVIGKATRGENGYRLYEETNAEELKLIKYARDMGLPLAEIKKLMKGCEGGHCEHSKPYVDKTIGEYLHLLKEKIAQLNNLKSNLEELQQRLKRNEMSCTEGPYCCDIFHQLLDYKNNKGGETK